MVESGHLRWLSVVVPSDRMKDVRRRRVENQADDFLTSKEDLSPYDDRSLTDSAIHSDFSNGSAQDLVKSPFSDVAVSCERNSLRNWTERLSCRCSDSCGGTSCPLRRSREQTISYSDRRERNKEYCSKTSTKRDPTVYREGGDLDWVNVPSFSPLSPDLDCCNAHDEDPPTQHSNVCRDEQQCDGDIRELQREKHLHRNFTHESLTPITEWQGLEELECNDSDHGISDVESEDSDALWSPSPEDVPSIRPEAVPKLDLSWVFEDETRKKKRSGKRVAALRRTDKGLEINAPVCGKLLKTSISSDTSNVAETLSMNNKAETVFSECFEEVSLSTGQQDEGLQDTRTDAAQYPRKHYSVDQTALARKLRPHHGTDDVNQVADTVIYDNAPLSLSSQMKEKAAWLQEISMDEEIFRRQARRSLIARCWPPEHINYEPYFDRIMSESRLSNPLQTNHYSKGKGFKCCHFQDTGKRCASESNVEDHEQPQQQESYQELAEDSLPVNDTNDQIWSDQHKTSNNRGKVISHECAAISNPPQVLQLARFYVIDERGPQTRNIQRPLVPQEEQETLAQAIHESTMSETNCNSSDGFSDKRENKGLDYVQSRTSDSEHNTDASNDLKQTEFIKLNKQTSNSGCENEVEVEDSVEAEDDEENENEEEEEEEGDQTVITDEPRSDEIYDVEAAVFRPGRRQKFVCFYFGCKTFCCKQTLCRPCYCDWKCDLKCFH